MRAAQSKKHIFKPLGFTLIELIVAISILAVMSAIGMTVYTQTQVAARDGRRIGDIEQIQKALEQYYNVNRSYPTAATVPTADTSYDIGSTNTILNPISSESYFRSGKLPVEPTNSGAKYKYVWCLTGKYRLCANLESCSNNKCNATAAPADCSSSYTAPSSGAGWYCVGSVSN